ncbi:MAG: EAL domain-containing protein [Thiobacillus sp.]|nr:EAL domain-containing protein [Thiobacillus sp.]
MTPALARLKLRTKLILASVLVQGVMIALLVGNSVHLAEQWLREQAQLRVESVAPLLNAALLGPMMQRDYGTAQDILAEALNSQGFVYLILEDMRRHTIASAGRVEAAEPPPLDRAADPALDQTLDMELAVGLGENHYGFLRYGVDVGFVAQARRQLTRQGLIFAGAAILASTFVLALIGLWLTRRLARLTEASEALARGEFTVELPLAGDDEVGHLAASFRDMAGQLAARLEQLRESEQRLFAISHYTYDMELWIDADGKTIWVNPSVLRMTGYSAEECLAMPGFPVALIHADDRTEAEWRLGEAIKGGSGEGIQFRLQRRNGSQFWAAANWQPIHDDQGRNLGVRASIRDISEMKGVEANMLESMRMLKESEHNARHYLHEADQERARLMALLSAMKLGILFVGEDGKVIYFNPAFLHIWGIAGTVQLIGKPALEVMALSTGELLRPEHFSSHLSELLDTRQPSENVEIPLRDGRILTQVSYPVREQGSQFIGYLWVYEDITQERRTAQQLLNLAERDSLTGLYNRHRFQEELARAVDEAQRIGGACALLFFDLDEFKAINDHFGHGAGDALLTRVANEVSHVVRRHESLFRLGGDEFAIVLPFAGRQHAQALADRVVRAISQITLPFDGQSLRISSSLGIALYPDHARDSEHLVAFADAAMYQAKQSGKNAWRVYSADQDTTPEMLHRLTWNSRLAEAVAQDRFELHFQGIYRLADRTIAHLEALIRLRDETSGELIPPGVFIPVAEKSARIVEIDRWVLRRVVAMLAERAAMPPVAVNLSGRSFDDPAMPDYIADLLREFRVRPERLLIEITETAAVSDLTDAQRFIESIRQTGCRVCLDDFGAGFASFAYLKHLQVDAIKIDGMFIRNLVQDRDNQVFVRGMLEVARGLGKETVAECVEDEAAAAMLARMGVDKVQGFHLDMPRADHPALG